MKKIFVLAFAAVSLVACNDGADNDDVTLTDSTDMHENADMHNNDMYTASEGDVKYMNNELMVMRNGEWVKADNDVTLDDGVVVTKNGKVTRNGEVIELHEGEVVTRTGRFFDNTGRAIEGAWDATKEGARKAGDKLENAANKVGNEVDEAFDNKKNN